jgi:hypothetical protein
VLLSLPLLLPEVPVLLSLSFDTTWGASYYCRWHLLLPEFQLLSTLSFAASWVASYYCRCPLLLSEVSVVSSPFTAAARAACASVAVFRCRLSCHYCCRCHLLPRKVPVTPRTLLSCHLTEVHVLLSLSFAATWGACAIVAGIRYYTWVVRYYCRWHLLLPVLPVTIVAVLCCYLSFQHYRRWHLLLPELPVTIVAVLCCYLSCQLLLSLASAAAIIVDNSQLQMAIALCKKGGYRKQFWSSPWMCRCR